MCATGSKHSACRHSDTRCVTLVMTMLRHSCREVPSTGKLCNSLQKQRRHRGGGLGLEAPRTADLVMLHSMRLGTPLRLPRGSEKLRWSGKLWTLVSGVMPSTEA